MNREYILISIATGRTSAEANNITLTDKEKRELRDIGKKQRKLKKKAKILYFMHLMRID